MDEAQFEQKLFQLFSVDLSEQTGEFRDALLNQCLDQLSEAREEELDEDTLEMLAAAGSVYDSLGNFPQ